MKKTESGIRTSGNPAKSPELRIRLGEDEVVVRFGSEESDDVKGKIRDILTASYEERMQALLTGAGDD